MQPPVYCSSCGKPNAPDAKFCNGCAQPLFNAQQNSAPLTQPVWQPPATIDCSSCRMANPATNEFCYVCHKPLFYSVGQPAAPSKPIQSTKPSDINELNDALGQLWATPTRRKMLGVAGIALFIFIIFAALYDQNTKRSGAKPIETATVDPLMKPFPAITSESKPAADTRNPAEALKQAKKALATNYFPKGKYKSWGHIAEARQHLDTIIQSDKEYAEAQKLYKEIERREAEIEIWSKAAARELFATELETTYLNKSMDVDLTVSGEGNTTIKFKYVLISRPMVYQLSNDSGFMGKLREYGFKKVIFTDGYYHTWTVDV